MGPRLDQLAGAGRLPLATAALEALADRPVRAAATIGGHEFGREVVPGNARVEASVPHAAVLARSRLLVNHAGHGTVMKALWHGVPMVLVPWGRDQPGVAARAERLGVAIVLQRQETSADSLGAAIARALGDRSIVDAAARHAVRLMGTDPASAGAALVEGLLG